MNEDTPTPLYGNFDQVFFFEKEKKLEWFDCAQSTGMPPTSRDRPFL